MFKKILTTSLMVASLVFAQEDAFTQDQSASQWESANTSSVQAPVSAPAAKNEDKMFSVSLHPLSLTVLAAFNSPWVFVTVETGFSPANAIISRPNVLWADLDGASLFGFGLMEGYRRYFNGEHPKGWYVQPSVEYSYYSGEDKDDKSSVTMKILSFSAAFGYKFMSGSFVFGSDIGVGYSRCTLEGTDLDDDDTADFFFGDGVGVEFNLYLGFAF